jgi:cyanophycinase-like exopeptidase
MRLAILVVCCLSFTACGGSRGRNGATSPTSTSVSTRVLVTATGTRPSEALVGLLQAAASPARVLVLSAGSDTASGPSAAADLRAAGAIATSIRLTRTMAQSGQITSLLGGVHAVWLTGTNPRELGAALGGTPTAVALEQRARGGLRMGGDGAGAGMLASVLITGGDVPPPRRRNTRQPAEEEVATGEGLGVLPGTLVYAPSTTRHKPDALATALQEHPRYLGVQLDSGAALRVMSDGVWESVGTADVLILVPDTQADADTAAATARRTRIVSPGSRFDPRTRTLLPLQPAVRR